MASPENRDDKKKTSSRAKKHSSLQKDSKPGGYGSKRRESCISRSQKVGPKKQTAQNEPQKVGPKKQTAQNECHMTVITQSKKADMANGTAKVSNKSACKRKKALPKLRGSYSLRSLDSSRALRSNTEKCKTPMNQASNPENLVTSKKKRVKKKIKNSGQDELSRIKKHIRYMLNRMNYEQSLIDAYSGEGWKGRSAEKIRPEKELERAKSEILRCKLKIREIFQHLDSLLAEGRLQESLFDPDGIDSENIFCGKCGSEDVSADNDIILCDGDCERGFHQKCLNPPLLSENVPTGDEGWLCPQCDCKVECIDLLNEFRGTDLSIEDSWERIFPEAAALKNGNRQYDDLNLPSDDSEDDDYDPDALRVDVDEQEDGSSYEESDSSSSSFDSTSSDDNANQVTVELPTDDSEDDDYDPDVADPDKEIHKNKSSSDESDFTSDSDEFCAELGKISYVDEASASSLPSLEFFVDSGRDDMKLKEKHINNSEVPSAMLEVDQQESGLRSSHKRDRERLDYKKLYDEAYGKSSSDSSDDEEWNEMSKSKKLKKTDDKGADEVTNDSFAKTTQKLRKKFSSSSTAEKEHGPQEPHSSGCSFATVRIPSEIASKVTNDSSAKTSQKLRKKFSSSSTAEKEHGPQEAKSSGCSFASVQRTSGVASKITNDSSAKTTQKSRKKLSNSSTAEEEHGPQEAKSSGCSFASVQRTSGIASKKLYEAFQANQYPTREMKESLAQELDMTFQQVTKWFGNVRHRESSNFEIANSEVSIQCETPTSHSEPDKVVGTKLPVESTPHKATDAIRTTKYGKLDKKKLEAAFQETQYPSREKKEELAQELSMTFQKVSRWFVNARRRSHVSAKESGNHVTSRTPDNQLGIGVEEKTPGTFTPDKTIITGTTSTSNAKPDNKVDQILVLGSPRDKVSTPKSCTSSWKPGHGMDLESPGVSIANGSASNKKGNKTVGAKFPKGGSERSRDGKTEADDRQKAIAKELRRMRTGR